MLLYVCGPFEVDDDHVAFDDPDWAADAAHGALTNDYALCVVYTGLYVQGGT